MNLREKPPKVMPKKYWKPLRNRRDGFYRDLLCRTVEDLGADVTFLATHTRGTGFKMHLDVGPIRRKAMVERFKLTSGMAYFLSVNGEQWVLWGRSTQSVLELVVTLLKVHAAKAKLAELEAA